LAYTELRVGLRYDRWAMRVAFERSAWQHLLRRLLRADNDIAACTRDGSRDRRSAKCEAVETSKRDGDRDSGHTGPNRCSELDRPAQRPVEAWAVLRRRNAERPTPNRAAVLRSNGAKRQASALGESDATDAALLDKIGHRRDRPVRPLQVHTPGGPTGRLLPSFLVSWFDSEPPHGQATISPRVETPSFVVLNHAAARRGMRAPPGLNPIVGAPRPAAADTASQARLRSRAPRIAVRRVPLGVPLHARVYPPRTP
jgi:hypothetical protein